MQNTEQQGITPACAGNTLKSDNQDDINEDHPRVCGEYILGGEPLDHDQGSPPRVRGIQFVAPCAYVSLRITPACAGNTV